MLNYDISRLKQRVEFGTTESVKNKYSGVSIPTFVSQFTVWCGSYSQTLTQQYTLLGTNQKAVKSIVIRHNDRVTDSLEARIDGQTYSVVSVNSDPGVNAFDVVTLQIVTGVKDE